MTEPTALDRTALDRHPLPPVVDGDKNSKGQVLVLAGSREVPGAALLTATAAMRAGAGKLRIATAQSIALAVGISMPEALVVGLPEEPEGGLSSDAIAKIASEAEQVDAIVAGPGLAQGPACTEIARTLLAGRSRLALDAALLHALDIPATGRGSAAILLPHAGELASLLDCDEQEIERDPLGCGLRAAKRYRAIVLVKGVTSHVVTPDGKAWVSQGGAPGLGVSGSGDVLAGIVGGLLARGAEPLSALLWAVWLHAEAGAKLAKSVGQIGFLAREIADKVPALLPR